MTPEDVNNLDGYEDVSHENIVQNQGMLLIGDAIEDLSNYNMSRDRVRREIRLLTRYAKADIISYAMATSEVLCYDE